MANHLESVCMRGAHDFALVDELEGMPYFRCVTGNRASGKIEYEAREVVVTSLTEGHRLASTYFCGSIGRRASAAGTLAEKPFGDELADDMGVILKDNKSKAHVPPAKWWNVFSTIFKYDPNALLHGVMFPQWQIKIQRVLTASLEAFGAARVDRSGVKFDRLGKTTSGQPIFAVDEETAREIRATFVIDLALVRSFGRINDGSELGLNESQKEFLMAFALWKIERLLRAPFRYRSGCHLEATALRRGDEDIALDVDIRAAIKNAKFPAPPVTDVYWPASELYREGKDEKGAIEEKVEELDESEE